MIVTAVVLWGAVILATAFVVYARLIEPENLQIRHIEVHLSHLPSQLEGLRVAHLSDFHCRRQRSIQRRMRRAVRETRHHQPDLVLITGDLAHGSENMEYVGPLVTDLDAQYGVYAVLGNHDWDCTLSDYLYGTPEPAVSWERWQQSLAQTNIRILENTHCTLSINDQVVVVAGVGDPSCGRDGLPATIEGTESADLRILLSHSPDVIDLPQAGWADLILAGHTHGGQCRLPGLGSIWAPVWRFRKRAAGLIRFDDTWCHVSRGVGAGVEARFLCPPEVVIMTLMREEARM